MAWYDVFLRRLNRREVLKTGAAAAASSVLPAPIAQALTGGELPGSFPDFQAPESTVVASPSLAALIAHVNSGQVRGIETGLEKKICATLANVILKSKHDTPEHVSTPLKERLLAELREYGHKAGEQIAQDVTQYDRLARIMEDARHNPHGTEAHAMAALLSTLKSYTRYMVEWTEKTDQDLLVNDTEAYDLAALAAQLSGDVNKETYTSFHPLVKALRDMYTTLMMYKNDARQLFDTHDDPRHKFSDITERFAGSLEWIWKEIPSYDWRKLDDDLAAIFPEGKKTLQIAFEETFYQHLPRRGKDYGMEHHDDEWMYMQAAQDKDPYDTAAKAFWRRTVSHPPKKPWVRSSE